MNVLSPSSKNTLTTLDGVETDASILPHRKAEKQVNEDVRNMMNQLFSCLEEELVNFIGYIEKQDSL